MCDKLLINLECILIIRKYVQFKIKTICVNCVVKMCRKIVKYTNIYI